MNADIRKVSDLLMTFARISNATKTDIRTLLVDGLAQLYCQSYGDTETSVEYATHVVNMIGKFTPCPQETWKTALKLGDMACKGNPEGVGATGDYIRHLQPRLKLRVEMDLVIAYALATEMDPEETAFAFCAAVKLNDPETDLKQLAVDIALAIKDGVVEEAAHAKLIEHALEKFSYEVKKRNAPRGGVRDVQETLRKFRKDRSGEKEGRRNRD